MLNFRASLYSISSYPILSPMYSDISLATVPLTQRSHRKGKIKGVRASHDGFEEDCTNLGSGECEKRFAGAIIFSKKKIDQMQFKARTIYVYEAFPENKENAGLEGPERISWEMMNKDPRDGDLWRRGPALLHWSLREIGVNMSPQKLDTRLPCLVGTKTFLN